MIIFLIIYIHTQTQTYGHTLADTFLWGSIILHDYYLQNSNLG